MALGKVASSMVSLGGVFQGSQTKANFEKTVTTALVAGLAAKFLGKSSAKAAVAAAVTAGAINGARGYKSVDSLRGNARIKEVAIQAAITALSVGAARLVVGKDFGRKQAGKMLAGAAVANTVGAFTEQARHIEDKTKSMTTNDKLREVFDDVKAPSTDNVDLTNEDARNASIESYVANILTQLTTLRAGVQVEGQEAAPLSVEQNLEAHQEAKVSGLKKEIDGDKTITEEKVIGRALDKLQGALEGKCGDQEVKVTLANVLENIKQAKNAEGELLYANLNISEAVEHALNEAKFTFEAVAVDNESSSESESEGEL